MKKLVSVVLALCMIIGVMPALAVEGAEDALIKIKEKINVPEELTEFEYSQSTYADVIRYDFVWHNEDYTKEMYVSSDASGELVSYNYYEQVDYSQERSLIKYTLADAQPLAERFVKDAFSEFDNKGMDVLELDESLTNSTYSGRYKTFSFTFRRKYIPYPVEANTVTVRVRATKDKIYVQSMSASLDNSTEVLKAGEKIDLAKDLSGKDYTVKFPIEIYYATDYSDDEGKVALFYCIDKGYVSRIDGEIVNQIYFDRYADKGYGAEEDAAMEGMVTSGSLNRNEALTEVEIKALEEMAGLVPVAEVEAKLRGLDILNITDDMKLDTTNANKYEDKYTVRFTLKGDKQTTSVTYDGETGEVVRIYSYFTNYTEEYDTEHKTSDSVSSIPTEAVKALTRELSGNKIDETKVEFTDNGEEIKYSSMNAVRLVNDIIYPENSINAVYDATRNMVTSYNISWDEDVSAFPNPLDAIGLNKAENIIFEIAPVYNTLVKIEDGYTPAITIPKGVTINAITGNEQYASNEGKQEYTDIDTHWAKEMINVLFEHDIYLTGDKFKPDEAITQADMILLFSACRSSGVLPIGWEKTNIAEYGVTNGYVESAEPDKLMSRKEGFEALVNVLGYGEVAGYDIYKTSYTDMNANGSAEILKAMGILKGDIARGDDYLTRAEAAVMVYRYLSK